ncbi:hypothetical protein C2G38_2217639 [Gigaspora rosea]|uniref:Uncharacterized protein n=1 Tax=Gigaspora rosea TaxID=44941 RepID=A0A397U7I2_9GLOM|nr:hypothetical protein C2G38_2217639 [Gigaspora rosea]
MKLSNPSNYKWVTQFGSPAPSASPKLITIIIPVGLVIIGIVIGRREYFDEVKKYRSYPEYIDPNQTILVSYDSSYQAVSNDTKFI